MVRKSQFGMFRCDYNNLISNSDQLAFDKLVEFYVANRHAHAEPEAPPDPHYVIRYVAKGGDEYGLVSVTDWNAGLSRAIADQVCDGDKRPLVVCRAGSPTI